MESVIFRRNERPVRHDAKEPDARLDMDPKYSATPFQICSTPTVNEETDATKTKPARVPATFGDTNIFEGPYFQRISQDASATNSPFPKSSAVPSASGGGFEGVNTTTASVPNNDPDLSPPGIPPEKLIDAHLSTALRHSFLRRVYAVLVSELIVAFGAALFFYMYTPALDFLYVTHWLVFVMLGCLLVVLSLMTCCFTRARRFPYNMILIVSGMVMCCFALGFLTLVVYTEVFCIALGITLGAIFGLFLSTFQSRWDFARKQADGVDIRRVCGVVGSWSYILALILIFAQFGCAAYVFLHRNFPLLILGTLAAVAFTCFVVFDTQRIIKGEYTKHQFSRDDYLYVAFQLFIDIFTAFLLFVLIALVSDNRSRWRYRSSSRW